MLRLILVLMVFLGVGLPAEAKRLALVVGNNSYSNLAKDFQLQKAVNDAEAMRDTLRGLGFEVIYLQNANLTEFKKAIFSFSAAIENGDVAAFFYAGHGAALKGSNYFLPSDVPEVALSSQPNEAEIEAQVSQLAEFSVKEALILEHMAKRAPQVSLVIVDACRNNPLREDGLENAFRSTTDQGVVLGDNISTSEKSLPEGMIIVYSAGFGQTALDRLNNSDSDPNSPFTRTLLKQLKQPGLGLGTVVKNTKEEVFRLAKSVDHKQTPSVYDQLFGGDVFLNGEPEKVTRSETVSDPGQSAFWAAGDNVEMLKVVEKRFKETIWAEFAASKIAKLEKQVVVVEESLVLLPLPLPPGESAVSLECDGVKTKVRGEDKCLAIKETFTDCDGCPEMVVVPAGSFLMGSPVSEVGHQSDEGPTRTVTVAKPLAVGKFEITRGEFDAFVRDSGFKVGLSCWIFKDGDWNYIIGKGFQDSGFRQDDSHPAVCISWKDAQAYAKWLSQKSGQSYRLLTEAEWEYAARAGSQTRFSFGEAQERFCDFGNGADQALLSNPELKKKYNKEHWATGSCYDKAVFTSAVGVYKSNNFGLHDMHGNVWEWVQDCYVASYEIATTDSSAIRGSIGCVRVYRGGGWDSSPQSLRSANRNRNFTEYRFENLGFRLARTF